MGEQTFRILCLLLDAEGEVVTREELRTKLWDSETFVDFDHGLNSAVQRLRDCLSDSAEKPRWIETIPRRGYRFVGQVKWQRDDETTPETKDESLPIGGPTEAISRGEADTRPRPWVVAVAVFILAGVVVALVLLRGKQSEPSAYFENTKVTRISADGNVDSVAISPDGHYIVFATRKNGKASLRVRQLSDTNSIEIASSENSYQNLLYSPDGNLIFYRQFDRTGMGFVYQIPSLGGVPRRVCTDVDSAVTISPDGRQLAFIRHNPPQQVGQIIVAMADGSGEKVLVETKYPKVLDFPSWSRDGTHLACTFREALLGNLFDLVEVDVGSGKQSAPLLHNWRGIAQIAWTTHSDGLIFVAQDEIGFNRGQLFSLLYSSGTPRKITNGIDNFDGVSVSADSQHLVTVLERFDSNIWLAGAHDLDHPKEFTSDQGDMNGALGLAYSRDGKIVFSSRANGHGTLWIGNPRARTTQQLIPQAGEDFAPWVMPDGSVVFTSPRGTGKYCLWHIDSDGTNPRQLTSGSDDRFPVSTPDGRWIFYESSAKGRGMIMKASISGGQPEIISDILSGPPAISPDGTLLAYVVVLRDGFKIAVEPLDHSWPRRLLPIPPVFGGTGINGPIDNIAWNHNGKCVQYINEVNGISNLWSQSISGGPPEQLTHFTSGHIFAFAWSPDYREFAMARGDITRDVVMIDEQ
jgi:Tol biopolymer transport system component/DNA-binding winged helix-turn-helix (wHTH) protein